MSAGHGGFENLANTTQRSALSDQHSVPKLYVNQVVQIGAGWADGDGKLAEINSGVDFAKSFKFGVDVGGSPVTRR